jgi:hypothetical protein
MFKYALFHEADFDNRCTFRWASATIPSLLEALPRLGVRLPKPLWIERRRNSIHVDILLQVRRLVLRAAGLASDECKDIQNRGNTAYVSRNDPKSFCHAGMFVREHFNAVAHTPQPIDLS